MPAESQNDFRLIYEGPKDESEDTLRRVKSALIADLNINIEQVKFILGNAPVTILKSKDEQQLKDALKAMVAAGAKVVITKPEKVKKKKKKESVEEEFELDLLEDDDHSDLYDDQDDDEEEQYIREQEELNADPEINEEVAGLLSMLEETPLVLQKKEDKNDLSLDEQAQDSSDEQEYSFSESVANKKVAAPSAKDIAELLKLDDGDEEKEDDDLKIDLNDPNRMNLETFYKMPEEEDPEDYQLNNTQIAKHDDLLDQLGELKIKEETPPPLNKTSSDNKGAVPEKAKEQASQKSLSSLSLDDEPQPLHEKVEKKELENEEPAKVASPSSSALSLGIEVEDPDESSTSSENVKQVESKQAKVESKSSSTFDFEEEEQPKTESRQEVEKTQKEKPKSVASSGYVEEIKEFAVPDFSTVEVKKERKIKIRNFIEAYGDILASTGIAVVILFVGNYLYYSSITPSHSKKVEIPKEIIDGMSEKEQQASEKKEIKEWLAYDGKLDQKDFSIETRIEKKEGELALVFYTMNFVPPSELKPHELVKNLSQPIRVEKIEIARTPLSQVDKQRFEGRTIAKVFYQDGTFKGRTIADAIVNGEFSADSNEVTMEVIISKGYSEFPAPESVPYISKKDGNGSHQIAILGKMKIIKK